MTLFIVCSAEIMISQKNEVTVKQNKQFKDLWEIVSCRISFNQFNDLKFESYKVNKVLVDCYDL